jgi:hypothetical protein
MNRDLCAELLVGIAKHVARTKLHLIHYRTIIIIIIIIFFLGGGVKLFLLVQQFLGIAILILITKSRLKNVAGETIIVEYNSIHLL